MSDSKIPDLRTLTETAQRIQAQMGRVKDELSSKTVVAETGGGLVRCMASGSGDIVSVELDPALMAGDKRMVEDLVVGAVNLALERARDLAREELARATAGLPMPPGLFGG